MFTDFINQLTLRAQNDLSEQRLQNALLIIEILFGVIDSLIKVSNNNLDDTKKIEFLNQIFNVIETTKASYNSTLKHLKTDTK